MTCARSWPTSSVPARHPAGRLFHYSNPGLRAARRAGRPSGGHGWDGGAAAGDPGPARHGPDHPVARAAARTRLRGAPVGRRHAARARRRHRADGPGRGARSTAEDLGRFATFLLDGDDRVLPATTLAEMRTPASPPGDEAWAGGYGLGLQLFRQDGRMLYGHSGSMPGFLATLCVSPADGVGAITLANATSGPDIAGIAIDLVRHRGRPRAAPAGPLDAAARGRPGALALTGPWYWGTPPLRAAVARRPRPGARARSRAGAVPPASAPSPTAPGPA